MTTATLEIETPTCDECGCEMEHEGVCEACQAEAIRQDRIFDLDVEISDLADDKREALAEVRRIQAELRRAEKELEEVASALKAKRAERRALGK